MGHFGHPPGANLSACWMCLHWPSAICALLIVNSETSFEPQTSLIIGESALDLQWNPPLLILSNQLDTGPTLCPLLIMQFGSNQIILKMPLAPPQCANSRYV